MRADHPPYSSSANRTRFRSRQASTHPRSSSRISFTRRIADNVTTARIGTGTALDLTGGVDATATHHGASTTTTDGTALGADAAVGAAIALGFVDDSATATTARNITADGAVSFALA